MKKNGCLTGFLVIFLIGLVLYIVQQFVTFMKFLFLKFIELVSSFFNILWDIRLYILLVALLATFLILILYRKKLIEGINNILHKYKRVNSFLIYISYKYSLSFNKFRELYLGLADLFYDLRISTKEDLNQSKVFSLHWEIKISILFRDALQGLHIDSFKDNIEDCKSKNEIEASPNISTFEEMEKYIYFEDIMHNKTREIIESIFTKGGGNLSFSTLKERDNYIDTLKNLNRNYFICILYRYVRNLKRKKRDEYLKKLNDIVAFSKNLELEGNISFTISTSTYKVEHFVTSTSNQSSIEYKYYFNLYITNDILKQRFITKNDKILESKDLQSEKFQSISYLFYTSDDAIIKSFEVIELLQNFIDNEINVVRDYIETNIAGEAKNQI